jgi:hypothetical protein
MMCCVLWNVNEATVQRWYYTCMFIHMVGTSDTQHTHCITHLFLTPEKYVSWYFQNEKCALPKAGKWWPSNFYTGQKLGAWVILTLDGFVREDTLRWVWTDCGRNLTAVKWRLYIHKCIRNMNCGNKFPGELRLCHRHLMFAQGVMLLQSFLMYGRCSDSNASTFVSLLPYKVSQWNKT